MEYLRTPRDGTEKETLRGLLDENRAIMVWKLDGVSEEAARRPMVGSGTSLLGLVKHLAWVERSWFQSTFSGIDMEFPWSKEDPDADFRIEDDETIDDIIGLYEEAVMRSNGIIASSDLDDRAERGKDHPSLRWIVGHMVEETARHAGHADIVRELIDGTTGYLPGRD